jgi:hypothetical protein
MPGSGTSRIPGGSRRVTAWGYPTACPAFGQAQGQGLPARGLGRTARRVRPDGAGGHAAGVTWAASTRRAADKGNDSEASDAVGADKRKRRRPRGRRAPVRESAPRPAPPLSATAGPLGVRVPRPSEREIATLAASERRSTNVCNLRPAIPHCVSCRDSAAVVAGSRLDG